MALRHAIVSFSTGKFDSPHSLTWLHGAYISSPFAFRQQVFIAQNAINIIWFFMFRSVDAVLREPNVVPKTKAPLMPFDDRARWHAALRLNLMKILAEKFCFASRIRGARAENYICVTFIVFCRHPIHQPHTMRTHTPTQPQSICGPK